MEPAKNSKSPRVHMGPAPFAGGELVRLGECRVGVNGGEDRAQPLPVLHREDELGQQVPGMGADDGRAEDRILTRRSEELDEACRRPVGDGAIKVVDPIARYLVSNSLFLGLGFRKPDAGDLGVGECGPWNDPVIDPEWRNAPKSALMEANQA